MTFASSVDGPTGQNVAYIPFKEVEQTALWIVACLTYNEYSQIKKNGTSWVLIASSVKF